MNGKAEDHFPEQEAKHRFEAALRGARAVGHKPQSAMKLGKSKRRPAKSPGKRKPVNKSRG